VELEFWTFLSWGEKTVEWATQLTGTSSCDELLGLLVDLRPFCLVDGLLSVQHELVVLLVLPLGSHGG